MEFRSGMKVFAVPTIVAGLTAALSVVFFTGLSHVIGDALLGHIILVQSAAAMIACWPLIDGAGTSLILAVGVSVVIGAHRTVQYAANVWAFGSVFSGLGLMLVLGLSWLLEAIYIVQQ